MYIATPLSLHLPSREESCQSFSLAEVGRTTFLMSVVGSFESINFISPGNVSIIFHPEVNKAQDWIGPCAMLHF